MSKLPKLKNVWKDVDYVHKLNPEEKQWLYNFQLEYVFGITTNKELKNEAAQRYYAQRQDVMNNPTDKIILHHAKRKKKNKKAHDLSTANNIEQQSIDFFNKLEEKLNDDLDNQFNNDDDFSNSDQ